MSAIENLVKVVFSQFHAFGHFVDGRFVSTVNPGRDDRQSWGDPMTTVPIDMHKGFDLSQGAMVAHPFSQVEGQIAKYGEHETTISVQTAMDERKAFYDYLRENEGAKLTYTFSDDKGSKNALHEGLEAVKFTYKDLADLMEPYLECEPEYWIISGQRRSYAKLAVVLLAMKKHPGTFVNEKDYKFVVEVRDFVSIEDTMSMILEENRTNAKNPISEIGQICAAVKLLEQDPTLGERSVAHKLSIEKRGQMQKVYRAAKLAIRFPSLHLCRRLQLDPSEVGEGKDKKLVYRPNGYIPVKKLNATALQSLLAKATKCSADVKEAYKACNKEYRKNTPVKEVAETWFRQTIDGTVDVSSQPYGRADLVAMASSGRIIDSFARVGDVLRAIDSHDKAFFDALKDTEHTQVNGYVHYEEEMVEEVV